MKRYPSIPTEFRSGTAYHVFDKLDGSHIRAEWCAKSGFTRFASKNQMLDDSAPLAPSGPLFLKKYGADLERVFRQQGYEKAVSFCEYFGPNSFAGEHSDPPETMDVILFDVNPHRRGILDPAAFLKLFGHLHIPNYLGERCLDSHFVEAVRDGQLDGVGQEGVVCKAVLKNQLKMTKVKSRTWLVRLRADCRDDLEFRRRA